MHPINNHNIAILYAGLFLALTACEPYDEFDDGELFTEDRDTIADDLDGDISTDPLEVDLPSNERATECHVSEQTLAGYEVYSKAPGEFVWSGSSGASPFFLAFEAYEKRAFRTMKIYVDISIQFKAIKKDLWTGREQSYWTAGPEEIIRAVDFDYESGTSSFTWSVGASVKFMSFGAKAAGSPVKSRSFSQSSDGRWRRFFSTKLQRYWTVDIEGGIECEIDNALADKYFNGVYFFENGREYLLRYDAVRFKYQYWVVQGTYGVEHILGDPNQAYDAVIPMIQNY